MDSVQEEVQKRISQKYNWKRTVMDPIGQLERSLFRLLSLGQRRWTGLDSVYSRSDLDLGVDSLGRSVASCLGAYVNLLISRGVKLHVLVVLGSRAKGRGKPQSDVDAVVIASDLPGIRMPEFTNIPEKILNIRQQLLLTDFPLFIGIQPSSSCSKEEFIHWLKEFRAVALDAVYYGKVAYDDGTWGEVLQVFKCLEEKFQLRKTKLKEILLAL